MITLNEELEESNTATVDSPISLGQTPAPTMETEMMRPAIEAEEKYQNDLKEWKIKTSQETEKNLLGFDSYQPAEEEAVRKQRLIRSVMDAEHDLTPKSSATYEMARAQASTAMFGEALDDEQFFTKLTERAQTNKDDRDLDHSMAQSAFISAMAPDDVNFHDWGAENIQGSITGAENAKHLARWSEHQERFQEKHGDLLPEVNQMFDVIKSGGDEGKISSIFEAMDSEDRLKSLALLRMVVDQTKEGEGETEGIKANFNKFAENFGKSLERGGKGLGRKLFDGAMTTLTEVIANDAASMTSNNPDVQESIAEAQTGADKLRDDVLHDSMFRSQVRRIMHQEFDPIEYLTESETHLGSIERGIHAAPEAVGTSLLAAIPYVGAGLVYSTMKQSRAEEYMDTLVKAAAEDPSNTMSFDEMASHANTMGSVQALGDTLFENVATKGWVGRPQAINTALDKTLGIFKSTIARKVGSMAVSGGAELATELGQDIFAGIVQDAGKVIFNENLPEYDWDEHFDGYYWKVLETATAVAPLSMVGELAPSNKRAMDRFKADILSSEMTAAQAAGFREADILDVKEAAKKGEASLDDATQNLLANKDSNSEEAIEATHEYATTLENKAQAEIDAVASAVLMGVRTSPNSDLVEVYNSSTGEVLAEGLDREAASNMVTQLFAKSERERTYYHDQLVSQIEGSQELAKDTETVNEIRPFNVMTQTDAAEEFAGSEQRLSDEMALRERLEGGDGKISQAVFGASLPAGYGGRSEQVNVMFGGSNLNTAIHEHTHEVRRKFMRDGSFSFIEQVDAIESIDEAFRSLTITKMKDGEKVTVKGSERTFLPDGFRDLDSEKQETFVSEAISELAEMFVLRTRNGKKTKFRELLNKNLSSKAARGDKGAIKLKAFVRAMKEWYSVNLQRNLFMKKAEREGLLDPVQMDELQAKIFGETLQGKHDSAVDAAYDSIIDDNVPFSVGDIDKNLIAIHNLSEQNLDFARSEFNSIIAPSIAIVRKDISSFDSFGEISLIAPPSRVDPAVDRKNHVWNADSYTARFPRIDYTIDSKAEDEVVDELGSLAEELGSGRHSVIPNDFDSRGLAALKDDALFMYAFLKDTGRKFTPKMIKKAKISSSMKKLASKFNQYDLAENSDFISLVEKENLAYAEKKAAVTYPNADQQWERDDLISVISKSSTSELRRKAEKAVESLKPSKPDFYENRSLLRGKVEANNKIRSEFDSWIDDNYSGLIANKRVEDDTHSSGRVKYKPYTTASILSLMTKKLAGAEQHSGVGQVRSLHAKKFKSINQIKGDRDKIVSTADMEVLKEKIDADFSSISDELRPYYKYSTNSVFYLDAVAGAVSAGASLNDDFNEIPSEITSQIRSFIADLKTASSEYFEVKVADAVPFSDFTSAIVPKSANKETKDFLKSKGLRVKTYDPDVEGSRQQVTLKESDITKVSFSVGKVTSEQDAEYLELAKDPEANASELEAMVDAARSETRYNKKMYHGTWSDYFNKFKEGSHFSAVKEYAKRYESTSASSLGHSGRKEVGTPRTMGLWVKMDNPFDTRQPEIRAIFDAEFYRKWGTGTPLMESGLPDWNDGIDLYDFILEEHPEYDGIILDEGGDVINEVSVKRPESYIPISPNQIKSADPVTYDKNGEIIPLSERFNESSDDIRFSVGNSKMADSIITDVSKRITNPEAKVRIMGTVIEKMGAMKRDVDVVKNAFGKEVIQKAIVDPRTMKSLKKESAFRQADLTEQYVNEVHEQAGFILEQEDLAKLKEQPLHAYLSKPNDPLHGQMMSKSQAVKQDKLGSKDGDFDGAANVSRTLFGGTLMPDQASAELYEQGLIAEDDVNVMWEALEQEQASVTNRKEEFKDGKAKIADAKKRAREDSQTWLEERLDEQERDHNPRSAMLRSLAMYDAILMSLPVELRGKMGGYVQLAKLKTDEKRLEFMLNRMDKLEKVIDSWVKREADKDLKKFFKRAAAKRQKSGKTDKGKFDGESHKIFSALKEATKLSMEEVDAQVAAADSIVAQRNEVDSDTWIRNLMLSNLLPQFGDWRNQTAEGRTEALKAGWHVYERALLDAKIRDAEQRERYEQGRDAFKAATGIDYSPEALQNQKNIDKARGKKKTIKDWDLNLSGFGSLLERLFGRSAMTDQWTERQRAAEMLQSNMRRDAGDVLNEYFMAKAGSEMKGMKLIAGMMTPTIKTDYGTYSEMQSLTATMMWMQEDGRKHMEGSKDENGKVTSSWSYDQSFIDHLEDNLSDDAKGFRSLLLKLYEEGYAPINNVHKRVHFIDMPKISNYSPLTVKSFMEASDKGIDPFTMAGSGNAGSAGFTKRRSSTAVAEPSFEDAFTVFMSHTDQSAHFIAYAELSKDMNAILGQREVMNHVHVKAGGQGKASLKTWLDFYNEGGAKSAGARLEINRSLSSIFGRTAKMALYLRPSVSLIQTTILGGAMIDMPMKKYFKGMAKLASGQLDIKTTWKTEFIQQRYKDKPVMMQAFQSGDPSQAPNSMQYWVDRIAHYGISGADALFTSATYAIYQDHYQAEAVDLQLEGKEAEKYVMLQTVRSTERVSQPTRTGTRSIMENTERSPFKIMGMAFASDARMKASLLAQTLASGTKQDKARALIFFYIVNGFAASVIRNIWRDARDGDDDEFFDAENWDMKSMLVASMFGPINGVPILGDQLANAANDYFGERNYYGSLADGISKGAKPLAKADDYLKGDVDIDRVLKDAESIMTTVGSLNDKATPAKSVISLLRDLNKLKNNVIGE
ncbi:hypothetical protein OAI07_01380 [Akkermansiaceae bacterium]|nr:hypothetical protein [Akkermansiaceae bacterium]